MNFVEHVWETFFNCVPHGVPSGNGQAKSVILVEQIAVGRDDVVLANCSYVVFILCLLQS
jgi:hypothetical protein